MKFSEYMRQREEEQEQKQTGRKFTDYLQQEKPEYYAGIQEKKQQKVNDYISRVNTGLQASNMKLASTDGYISKNRETWQENATQQAEKNKASYEPYRESTLSLMKEAWETDLDNGTRRQALDLLRNQLASYQEAGRKEDAFAEYMNSFQDSAQFDETLAKAKNEELLNSMTAEEKKQRISENKEQIKQIKRDNMAAIYGDTKKEIDELKKENQRLKTGIFEENQKEALAGLSPEAQEVLEKYYEKENLASLSPLHATTDTGAKLDAMLSLKNLGVDAEDFDSLYEYYKFQKDEENTQKMYDSIDLMQKMDSKSLPIASVLATPLKGLAALSENLNSFGYEDEYAPLNTNSLAYALTNATDRVRENASKNVAEKYGNTANFLYQTGTSMLDMAATLPLNMIAPGASLAVMGTNAATEASKEATQRGIDKKHALLTGLCAGTAEAAFEKLSLDHFWEIAKKQGKAATRSAFLNVITQAGIEGSEELATDLANTFTDNLINNGLSEYYQNTESYCQNGMTYSAAKKRAMQDYAKQLGLSFLGGAISGGVFAGVATARTVQTGKDSNISMETVSEVADGLDTDKASYKTQEDYEKVMELKNLSDAISKKGSMTAYEKGLYEQAVNSLTTIQTDDTQELFGISESDSDELKQIKQLAVSLDNETVSKAFVSDYKEGYPVGIYTKAFNNFYKSAMTDISFDKALEANSAIASVIDRSTLYEIYTMGSNQAKILHEANVSQEQMEVVKDMARLVGTKVEFTDKLSGANGMLRNGVIHISNQSNNPAMVVFSHEMTHHLKTVAEQEYSRYEDYVIQYLQTQQPKEYQKMYDSIKKAYKTTDEQVIREEIAANASEMFMTDATFVEQFATKQPSIAQRICDFFGEFINRLKKLYAGYRPTGKAAQILSADIKAYEKARDLWYQALTAYVDTQADESNEKGNDRFSLKDNDIPTGFDVEQYNRILGEVIRFHNENFKKFRRIKISEVSERMSRDLLELTGKDFSGYVINANTDTFKHIEKRHGKNGEANKTMEYPEDIALMHYVLNNYDNAELVRRKNGTEDVTYAYSDVNGNPAKMVSFSKQINGMQYVVLAVPENKYKKLWVVSEYKKKEDTSCTSHDSNRTLPPTPVAHRNTASSFVDNITQADEKSNDIKKVSESDTENAQDKNKTNDWLKRTRVQFPVGINQYGLIKKLAQQETNVNQNQKMSLKDYDLWDKKNPRISFEVSKVSEPLVEVGVDENKKILFDSKKIIRIKSEHGEMTDEVIKNIDKIIENPMVIMNSATVQGRITMVGELEAENGVPVMIALELHPMGADGIEIDNIKICSAYTKDNFEAWLKKQDYLWINPDKNKTYDWLKRTRVQFPVGINQYGLIKTLSQDDSNVNMTEVSDTKSKKSLKEYADEIGIKFSEKEAQNLFDVQESEADNRAEAKAGENLQNIAKLMQEGMQEVKTLQNAKLTKQTFSKIAAPYVQEYQTTYDRQVFYNNAYNLFEYMYQQENTDYEDMLKLLKEVCRPVVENATAKDIEASNMYRTLKRQMKKTEIRLTQEQQDSIADVYGSFEKFKILVGNSYHFTEEGTYLDDLWTELAEKNKDLNATDKNDRMLILHQYMENLRKKSINPTNYMNTDTLSQEMAMNILNDYFRYAVPYENDTLNRVRNALKTEIRAYDANMKKGYKIRYETALENAKMDKDAELNIAMKKMDELHSELEKQESDNMYAIADMLHHEISKLEEEIAGIKSRNVEKIADYQAEYGKNPVERAFEKRRAVYTNRIKRNINDLNSRLTNPKDNRYVPKQLVLATVDVCEAINLDSGRSEKLAEKMAVLRDSYNKIKTDADYVRASEYNEHTEKSIERLHKIFLNRDITRLTTKELQEVDELVEEIHHQIVNAGELIGREKSEKVYEAAVRCMEEIMSSKGINNDKMFQVKMNQFNTSMLNPKRQFRRMSGYKENSVLSQIYEDLNAGQQKQMQVLMETARMFDPVTKGEHNQKAISKFVGKETDDWIDLGLKYKNEEAVKVPRSFRVSLAMHIQNKANLDHIIYGGLTIPNVKAYQRGDYKAAYATGTTIHFIPPEADTKQKRQQAYREAVEKLESVVAEMTPYEKSVLKCSEEFFHEYTGKKINETSLLLNGYKKARVQKYFPIVTDSNYLHAVLEGLKFDATLEGMGMLEHRVNARNPILLEDVTKVIQRHSENVAKYYGLAIPIRNFNKIYNATKIGYQDSTKSVIASKWGLAGQEYVENLITDLQTKRSGGSSILDTLQGNFAQSVLSGNLSVAAQQIVAYPTAAATLGWDAVTKGIRYIPTKLDMDHIAKYTPLLWYRNQGTGTQEIGDVNKSKDLMSALASKTTVFLEHNNLKGLASVSDKVEKGINWEMELLQRIDTKAVGSLWKASEIYVRETKGILPENGEDAFYQEVAKVFNECVDDTQANYSTMQRPDILRNPNKALKMILLFKTQPLQNFGIIYDAFGNLRTKTQAYKDTKNESTQKEYEQAKLEFSRAISSQLAAAAGVFMMKFLANVLTYNMERYRDDEDEITGWKILEEMLDEVASTMAGSVIGGSEAYDFIKSMVTDDKYYGVSVGVVDSFNDFTDSLLKAFHDPEWENLKQLYFDAGVLIGVPGENMYKFLSGIKKHVTDMTDGKSGYFYVGHETKLSVQYQVMLNALVDGDAAKYEKRYEQTMERLLMTKEKEEAEKTITSGIKAKLKANYIASEISYDDAYKLLTELGDEEAHFTLEKWDNAENEEYNKYNKLQEAVRTGTGIKEETAYLTEHGVNEDTVKSKTKSMIKEMYEQGSLTKEQTSVYLKEYWDMEDENDIYWKLQEWDSTQEEYGKYDKLLEAFEKGNFKSVLKEYTDHGVDASAVKTAIKGKYKKLYMDAYLNGEHKKLDNIKEKLNTLVVNGKRLFGATDYLEWNKEAKQQK